jgi:hypothetical protein
MLISCGTFVVVHEASSKAVAWAPETSGLHLPTFVDPHLDAAFKIFAFETLGHVRIGDAHNEKDHHGKYYNAARVECWHVVLPFFISSITAPGILS